MKRLELRELLTAEKVLFILDLVVERRRKKGLEV
jgi:hypothetical protein